MDIIERQGRKYYYSPGDDCWFPLPTEAEYQRQLAVIWVGAAAVIGFVIYACFIH